ncbi:MAG: UDP-N-acetylmuramoyl-tripeptide--D-alanyl-D-alanine ligase, partial [Flavobacteriales bacterium]
MKIDQLHSHFLNSSGICTDTRKISKNCLFFSLKGDHFNGNKFAKEALSNGAYKAIIEEKKYQTEHTILVKNCLETLQKLANYHRNYLKIPILALTGSNGKTTTKELIKEVLSQKYKVTATKGNLNNHIGVPLTLLSMDLNTEIAIVEMGANHYNEITQLCEIIQPDYGYITNFGKAHLEGFGSLEGVIEAKTELFQYLKENNKTVFVNATDDIQLKKSKHIKRITFGEKDEDCNLNLKDASKQVTIVYKNTEIKSNLIGLYNFNNIAASICIGHYFKVSKEKIKYAIEHYTPTNNRSQVIKQNSNTIILDAYNANPTSMLAALENLIQTKSLNKVLILGDMFELGTNSSKEHQNLVHFIEQNTFNQVYLVGNYFFETLTTSPKIKRFKKIEELKQFLNIQPLQKSTILIKGSRGMALE